MADQIIGEAAQATAAEGGAVVLIPNEEAEAAEQEATPEEQVPIAPVILEANPTIIVEDSPADDRVAILEERIASLEMRLLDALSNRSGGGVGEEVGPPPEPQGEETVIEPTEEVAPKAEEKEPERKHAGFWI